MVHGRERRKLQCQRRGFRRQAGDLQQGGGRQEAEHGDRVMFGCGVGSTVAPKIAGKQCCPEKCWVQGPAAATDGGNHLRRRPYLQEVLPPSLLPALPACCLCLLAHPAHGCCSGVQAWAAHLWEALHCVLTGLRLAAGRC